MQNRYNIFRIPSPQSTYKFAGVAALFCPLCRLYVQSKNQHKLACSIFIIYYIYEKYKRGSVFIMAIPVIMPKQGISVESCIITKWYKQKGENINSGDLLYSYETDKASFDVEAPESGVLLDIFYNDGDEVPVLVNVCVIGAAGESTAGFAPVGVAAPVAEAPAIKEAVPVAPAVQNETPIAPQNTDGELKISPRARNLAEKSGVDAQYSAGTGPQGRVIERDIRDLMDKGIGATKAAIATGADTNIGGTGIGGKITVGDLTAPKTTAPEKAPETADEVTVVKMSNIRKVISKSMQASLNNLAQLTLNASFDATNIMAFRKNCKENGAELGLDKITINDIILYAVARTLVSHKDLNANLIDDSMHYFKNVNLGIAVDTERGLMVPTLFNANKKSLTLISKEAKSLAAAAQGGTISPDALRGGTFTITNLGTLGIESFTPVINPPQTGILGVNTLVERVKTVNGNLTTYQSMTLSLTFDHRAIDGAPAARFLKDLKTNLENFSLLLAK
jgi:pyruvate dehydrogenase E2 component (dihydrolipoamide acetyltransferase)